MILTYNSIRLEIEQVIEFTQDAVYSTDGKDFLYTHVRVVVRAIWHPRATTSGGTVAAESIDALRASLMAPRKLLRIAVPSGGEAASKTILLSPLSRPVAQGGTAYPVDAANGPAPIALNVIEIRGERMAVVDYAIETWVNECSEIQPVLSHRWTMIHDIDENYFTTRTIEGVAVFRTDYLNRRLDGGTLLTRPDEFRAMLFHPVPNNFKRTLVRVSASADGTTLSYTAVDVQQPFSIVPGYLRITKIRGTYSEVMNAYSFGIPNANNLLPIRFPTVSMKLVLQVWGRPIATRRDLINALIRGMNSFNFGDRTIAQWLAGGVTLHRAFFNSQVFIVDLWERYAEMHCEAEFDAAAAEVLRRAGQLPGIPINTNFPETIPGLTTRDETVGFRPWHWGGTRGDYLEMLATHALKTPCEEITFPPATARQ